MFPYRKAHSTPPSINKKGFFKIGQTLNFVLPLPKATSSLSAEVAHLVEHDLAKVGVAGSSPVFRSKNPLLNKRGFFLPRSPGGEIGRHAGLK